MMQPGLGAVIFLTLCIIVVFGIGAFLVYRVMNTPGSHIGSRLPKHDPHAEADPTDPPDRGPAEGRTQPEDPSTDNPDSPESPDPGHRHP